MIAFAFNLYLYLCLVIIVIFVSLGSAFIHFLSCPVVFVVSLLSIVAYVGS